MSQNYTQFRVIQDFTLTIQYFFLQKHFLVDISENQPNFKYGASSYSPETEIPTNDMVTEIVVTPSTLVPMASSSMRMETVTEQDMLEHHNMPNDNDSRITGKAETTHEHVTSASEKKKSSTHCYVLLLGVSGAGKSSTVNKNFLNYIGL